jgi:hypothetical protein
MLNDSKWLDPKVLFTLGIHTTRNEDWGAQITQEGKLNVRLELSLAPYNPQSIRDMLMYQHPQFRFALFADKRSATFSSFEDGCCPSCQEHLGRLRQPEK